MTVNFTADLAAKNHLSIDPWTTYPNGKPKALFMIHRAVLVTSFTLAGTP
ncbi:MAG: hypothetical protein K9H25_13435 [Rhodospirillum sp.]|nr:hypothetical protein [Rhodospirillum sp.]MCF8490615.1 hypothetical protein [Rhodospirillum sp.]MCF8498938.1 hypothetical protein [Rhodospirillum sp.]